VVLRAAVCAVRVAQLLFGSDVAAVRKETAPWADTAAVSFARYFYGDQRKYVKKDGAWNRKEKIQKLKD